jgi:hypothetical protein
MPSQQQHSLSVVRPYKGGFGNTEFVGKKSASAMCGHFSGLGPWLGVVGYGHFISPTAMPTTELEARPIPFITPWLMTETENIAKQFQSKTKEPPVLFALDLETIHRQYLSWLFFSQSKEITEQSLRDTI